jgi:hypothetical protein
MITFGTHPALNRDGKLPTVKLPSKYAAASLNLLGFDRPRSEGKISFRMLPGLCRNIMLRVNSQKNRPQVKEHELTPVMNSLEMLHELFVLAKQAGEDIYWG